jgi:polyphenol oxidase
MEILTPEWPAPSGVRAAFTLREGGVSEPPFATLNLGLHTGDAPHAVKENRRRVGEALRLPGEPAWLDQVHGADVIALGPGRTMVQPSAPPRADAAVTREPRRVLAIQVADCLPILLAARDCSAVGAVHAGWRGLAAGVLEAAVRALGVGPSAILAWLGPGIGAAHFEVGEEVREAFLHHGDGGRIAGGSPGPLPARARAQPHPAASAFVRNARGRWQCDLAALARLRLEGLGVRGVYGGNWCTFADPARFFSYRREGRCGRMAALIWIENSSGCLRAGAAGKAGHIAAERP